MVGLRQGRIMTLLCVLFISCSAVDGNDDNTIVKPGNENCNCDLIRIIMYATASAAAASIAILMVVAVIYFRRNLCCTRCQERELSNSNRSHTSIRPTKEHLTKVPSPSHTPNRPTEDDFIKGRISNVELWKLVVYSADSEENDKLKEALRQLTPDVSLPGYGACHSDDYRIETENLSFFQRLCRWKEKCTSTEEMDKLFEACSQAGMGDTVHKLEDFRKDVSVGVSEYDLKHILWQIGRKSSENITTLLNRLSKSPFDQESSVPRNVDRALPELKKWIKGNLAINPVVMLSLQSDDWCDEDKYFFEVSEEDKSPVEGDIKLHVCNVSKAHCQKIISIISTKGKSKRNEETKVFDRIIAENETDLFNTYQMIKEWLGEQECSNYEKRITLRNAVEDAQNASTSNEIQLGEIKQLAADKGDAEAAYELLMKDIKPFAENLRLDESKLIKYKQVSRSPQSPRGTIGLVAVVRAIKGKK